METDILTIEEIELVHTILQWLPSATKSDIEIYCRELLQKDPEILQRITPTLLSQLITDISSELSTVYASNAGEVFSGPELLSFLSSLSRYSSKSVIKNFQKEHPGLVFDSENKNDIAYWSSVIITKWYNTFFLVTCSAYINYSIYLKSIVELGLVDDDLKALQNESSGYITSIANFSVRGDFTDSLLPQNLSYQINNFLRKFIFLPVEMTEKLKTSPQISTLFPLLRAIDYDLSFLLELENYKEINEESIKRLLWEGLKFDAMGDFFKLRNTEDSSEVSKTREEYLYKLNRSLDELITLQTIGDGTVRNKLKGYVTPLSNENRSEFKTIIQSYIRNSSLFTALLENVNIDSVIANLENIPAPGERQDYLSSLQSEFSPDTAPYSHEVLAIISDTVS